MPVFRMRENFNGIPLARGAKSTVGGHAMRIDDLPPGDVHYRIGNKAGAAAGQILERDHRCRRDQVVLAGPDQSFVTEFVKSQARISMNVAAVKTAKAIDCDGVRAMPLQNRFHPKIHRRR